MPFSSAAVANYILDLADEEGELVSPMKLQKLVYYAHGWHLALLDQPLIDENVEAWKFGPVIPSLYYAFRQFGADAISDVRAFDDFGGHLRPASIDDEATDGGFLALSKSIIKRVWDLYKGYTAVQLSNATHLDGTPWRNIYREDLPKGTDIPNKDICDYFKRRLKPVR